MNDAENDLEQELFIAKQRLAEARMALVEAAAQKDELRDTAAALALEVRELRVRVTTAEAQARAADRERELLAERLAARDDATTAIIENLERAQRDTVVAYENNDERDLQIDQLQLQVMELRLALARARGFAPPPDARRATSA